MRYAYLPLLCLLALPCVPRAEAGEVDFGLGIGLVDSNRGGALDGGWDLQLGYELRQTETWHVGAQLALFRGITSQSEIVDENDLSFSSTGLYLTARPKGWWLQFKGGAVQADYHSLSRDEHNLGYGLGVGVVLGDGAFRLHLLDYQRLTFGADSFNQYTVSFAVLAN